MGIKTYKQYQEKELNTKKKKSAVIAVNGRTISVITITNNVIRCNNYNDTVITNIN